nr:hypothetical protein [Tanacetum cinerariifolium]
MIELESHKEHPEIVDDDENKKEKKYDNNDDDVNDDHTNHTLDETHEMGSLETRNEKMQTPIPLPHRSPLTDLSLDKSLSQELTVTVSPTIIKRSLQDQADDPELREVLKCKFEKSYTLFGLCRTNTFYDSDHDDHQEDDAPPEGRKEQKGKGHQKD